ncbi:MAG: 30S ribosomal protein S1 [Deltaproteobacteria bacterium]|nr:30S ribosomal protein S1 [Deltaproteobacteria bacterium]
MPSNEEEQQSVEASKEVTEAPEAKEVAEPEAAVEDGNPTEEAEAAPAAEEVAKEEAPAAPEVEAASTDTDDDDDSFAEEDAESEADRLAFEEFAKLIDESMHNLVEGEIVTGRIIEVRGDTIIVDVGYKSEGLIPAAEFRDRDGQVTVGVGDEVEVLLEKTEDQEGHVLLSRQKAERMRRWNEVEKSYKEGAVIKGRVLDRIKGGLTVDVGLRAFLPGSLVDIKPVKNLESLKGHELEFKVISLDRRRNNIVLSRKAVLEKEFAKKKKETLANLREGAVIQGVVKNITDYGVFIDLGGIDGLLHITDISWGRVNHPSEHFSVGDEVEIVVLKFDPENERVSLGYKQRSDDPWTLVDKKYPIGSRIDGKVVSLVDYGAFVEIEEGVEGLIHVSEMSWTKKVVNPAKILNVGDQVQAIVSELDMGQRRISLSLRQTERNPWEELSDGFPVGSIVEGKVRNLTEFGAFVEITEGIDGLIHVSDMSWTKRVKHPAEILQKGETVKARITNIDVSNQRVSLSIKEFMPNEWQDFVDSHHVGDIVEGRVVNVTDFGLFVDIYEGLEGLVHVSEADLPSTQLQDHFAVGDWVRARILRIEEEDKKVGLTIRGVNQPTAEEIAELEASQPAEEPAEEEAEAGEAEGSSGEDAATDESSAEATEEAKEASEGDAADEASEDSSADEATEDGSSDDEDSVPDEGAGKEEE